MSALPEAPLDPTTPDVVLAQGWPLTFGLGTLIGALIANVMQGAGDTMEQAEFEKDHKYDLTSMTWQEVRLPYHASGLIGEGRRIVEAVRMHIIPGTYFNAMLDDGGYLILHRLIRGGEVTPYAFVQLMDRRHQIAGGLILEFGAPNPAAREVCDFDGGPPGRRGNEG